jgi:uncharacterized repeat protein (TIGR03803 family)
MAYETKAWSNCRVALTLCVLILTPNRSFAQSFTVLHTFSQTSSGNPYGYGAGANPDGANPQLSLVLSGSMLYGTSSYGGKGSGVVFGINTNGGGFTNLHSFSPTSGGDDFGEYLGTNADGAQPLGLLISGNTLYGVANYGGTGGYGTVFKLNTDGTQFTTLYSFTNGNDGAYPRNLVLSGGALYGLSTGGYESDNSLIESFVVYMIETNGGGFTPLYQSTAGYWPGGLALSGDTLYIAADVDAYPYNICTIFDLNTNGLDLQTFWALDPYTNGANVNADPIIVSNVLYCTAPEGGSGTSGTVFSISTSSREFNLLHAFSMTTGNYPYTNNEGAQPGVPVVLSGNTLFGTASGGGNASNGTLFQVKTDGTCFRVLHTFSAFNSPFSIFGNCDGAFPASQLVVAGNSLFGTALRGGIYGNGTIFALAPTPTPIPLNFQWTNNAVVLSWTNAAFALQSAPALSGVYTNVPGASSPYTNAATGSQMFFRLVAN